jgi:hypothetical protein
MVGSGSRHGSTGTVVAVKGSAVKGVKVYGSIAVVRQVKGVHGEEPVGRRTKVELPCAVR